MVHAVAARGRLACCTCGAGGAGVPMSVEHSGSLRPRRAAPLPLQIYHGKIKSKTSEPFLVSRNPRVEFVGSTTGKDNNISIVLKDVELSDAGKYTCHVKNPKEKNAQHNATIILTVVHRMEETDNTLTLIIVGVVGGLFGLLILFMLVKRVVLFIIKKTQDGKKECLVSSSGNDNTENGLAGSKAEQKAPPKA